MGKTANIAFWGGDVAEISTLVHALKTGHFVKQSASIYPIIENIKIKDVTLKVTIPSANESARRSFLSALPDFDGIVYVADNSDSVSISTTKEELESLLGNATISRPILVLISVSDALPGTPNEKKIVQGLGIAEKVGDKEVRKAAVFAYSLLSGQHKGYNEGLEWLVKHL